MKDFLWILTKILPWPREREREQGERALQLEFYNTYFLRVDKNLSIDQIQNNYTDGIINGNIL
ncbi:hypothetical protein DR090_03715, partial [Mycoplasma hyopneumoniae]|nr:hypothetical protein [Mesomycoplasma hyopneumoniae]